MCLLLELVLPRVFVRQPLTVQTRQTRQVVRAINQSIFKYDVYGKSHRHPRKVDCSSFVMCLQLLLALPRFFLQWPLTVQTRQTRKAVRAINQSIFKYDVYGKSHRYPRKVDCSSFVMCPQLLLALPRVFLWQPLTVLTRQTR
jgi:hypothetical protein